MKTVLIVPVDKEHHLERWEIPDENDPVIDHITDNLADFLRAIL
jgi:putative hydrolase of the HAD superfamily